MVMVGNMAVCRQTWRWRINQESYIGVGRQQGAGETDIGP